MKMTLGRLSMLFITDKDFFQYYDILDTIEVMTSPDWLRICWIISLVEQSSGIIFSEIFYLPTNK